MKKEIFLDNIKKIESNSMNIMHVDRSTQWFITRSPYRLIYLDLLIDALNVHLLMIQNLLPDGSLNEEQLNTKNSYLNQLCSDSNNCIQNLSNIADGMNKRLETRQLMFRSSEYFIGAHLSREDYPSEQFKY